MLASLFSSGGGASGGGLMDVLSKGGSKMGGANSAMSGPVPGAVLPRSGLNQALSSSPTATNPMMSSNIGAQAPPATTSAPNGGDEEWVKWATPQDTSAGLSAYQQQDPMYSQMTQQVMQPQQQQQQQPRQPMTPAGMPQMPGAIAPQNNLGSLIQRLLGGR